jgi:hypothetical protein
MKIIIELFLANIRHAARALDGGDPETAVEYLETARALAPTLDERKTCEKAHEEASLGNPERAEHLLESLISDFAAPHKKQDCKNSENPRLKAFDQYYSTKEVFYTRYSATCAAKSGDWICRCDNQRGGHFYTIHKRFINPAFNARGFLKPGTILGMWNEITYLKRKAKGTK